MDIKSRRREVVRSSGRRRHMSPFGGGGGGVIRIPWWLISNVSPLVKSSFWGTKISPNEFFNFWALYPPPSLLRTTFFWGGVQFFFAYCGRCAWIETRHLNEFFSHTWTSQPATACRVSGSPVTRRQPCYRPALGCFQIGMCQLETFQNSIFSEILLSPLRWFSVVIW